MKAFPRPIMTPAEAEDREVLYADIKAMADRGWPALEHHGIVPEGLAIVHGLAPADHASAESRALADRVLENLAGISAQWLAGAAPMCERLIEKAEDGTVTDEDFISAVEKMAVAIPDQFDTLDWRSLAREIEAVQGAAMANGAARRIREFLQSQKQNPP